MNASGTLYKADLSLNVKEKMTSVTFAVNTKNDYQLRIFKGYIFLQENQTLYLLNTETEQFERFFDEISGIETNQILQYANRAIHYAVNVADVNLHDAFVKRLEKAWQQLQA